MRSWTIHSRGAGVAISTSSYDEAEGHEFDIGVPADLAVTWILTYGNPKPWDLVKLPNGSSAVMFQSKGWQA